MNEIPDFMLVHQVTVEPQTGEAGIGDTYGPPRTCRAFVEYNRQLVRDATGAEVVSEATVFMRLDEQPHWLPDSRVTLPDGSVSYVLRAAPRDGGNLGVPNHLEVTLR